MDAETMKYLAAAIALLPMIGAALGLGKMFAAYFDAIARNPTAAKELNSKFFVAVAFVEALGLLAWVIGAIMIFG